MQSAEFFSLAWRVAAYPGVIRYRLAQQQEHVEPQELADLIEIVKV